MERLKYYSADMISEKIYFIKLWCILYPMCNDDWNQDSLHIWVYIKMYKMLAYISASMWFHQCHTVSEYKIDLYLNIKPYCKFYIFTYTHDIIRNKIKCRSCEHKTTIQLKLFFMHASLYCSIRTTFTKRFMIQQHWKWCTL